MIYLGSVPGWRTEIRISLLGPLGTMISFCPSPPTLYRHSWKSLEEERRPCRAPKHLLFLTLLLRDKDRKAGWDGPGRGARERLVSLGALSAGGGAGPHFGSLGSNRSQWPHQRGGHEMGHVACSFLWGKCSPLMPRASPPSPKRGGHASRSLHHCFVPSDTPGKAGRRTAVGLQPPGHSCGTCPCRLKAPHP